MLYVIKCQPTDSILVGTFKNLVGTFKNLVCILHTNFWIVEISDTHSLVPGRQNIE